MSSGYSVPGNILWHRRQIAYDRLHFPPSVARDKIDWHKQQILYNRRRKK